MGYKSHSVPAVMALANAVGAATAMGAGAGRNVASVDSVRGLLLSSVDVRWLCAAGGFVRVVRGPPIVLVGGGRALLGVGCAVFVGCACNGAAPLEGGGGSAFTNSLERRPAVCQGGCPTACLAA